MIQISYLQMVCVEHCPVAPQQLQQRPLNQFAADSETEEEPIKSTRHEPITLEWAGRIQSVLI